jgi:hypothetical protein
MNSLATKRIATVKAGTAIDTGLVATVTGNYIFEVFQFGSWQNITVALNLGDAIEFPNTNVNENSTIQFRVKLPASAQTTESYYATTANGQIIFEYTNLP